MTIRVRVWGLGLIISVLLLIFFLIGLQHTQRLTDDISQGIDQTNKGQVRRLMQTERDAIVTMLYIQTWWDDMVDYIQTRDQDFADENVEDQLDIYGLDAGFIFTPDFEPIYGAFAEVDEALVPRLSPSEIKAAFHSGRSSHFFMVSSGLLFEFFGASIHPDFDEKGETPPRGYMVVARLWDVEFNEKISQLSASTVTLDVAGDVNLSDIPANSRFSIPLLGLDGSEVGVIYFSQHLGYMEDHQIITRRYINHLAAYYLLLVVVLWLGLYVWTLRPMKQIAKSLQDDSLEPINHLIHYSDVGEVAKKIRQRLQQAAELEKAWGEAETAKKARQQFLRNLSHEFKTPLNGVFGATQLLETTELNNEQKEYLGVIGECGKNLDILINELLTLTRLESGTFDVKEAPFELAVLLDDLAREYQRKASVLELAFQYNAPESSLPESVSGDESSIREIIHQLLRNALKFTSAGSIDMNAEIRAECDEKLTLHISISDTGIGLQEERLSELMEMFTQVDNSDTRRYDGMGIGLALARSLTSRLNGTISASSKEGKGSCFSVELPLRKIQDESDEFYQA